MHTPFCYTIWRPGHDPDAILAIECISNTTDAIKSIETIVQTISGESAQSIFISIIGTMSIEMKGPCFLHGWIQNCFATSDQGQFNLIAKACQFSNFILLVDVMAGPEKFNPKEEIILQNKDKVLISHLLIELPKPRSSRMPLFHLAQSRNVFSSMPWNAAGFICLWSMCDSAEALNGSAAEAAWGCIDKGDLFDTRLDVLVCRLPDSIRSVVIWRQWKFKCVRSSRYCQGTGKVIFGCDKEAKKSQLDEVSKVIAMNFLKSVANMADSSVDANNGMEISQYRSNAKKLQETFHSHTKLDKCDVMWCDVMWVVLPIWLEQITECPRAMVCIPTGVSPVGH